MFRLAADPKRWITVTAPLALPPTHPGYRLARQHRLDVGDRDVANEPRRDRRADPEPALRRLAGEPEPEAARPDQASVGDDGIDEGDVLAQAFGSVDPDLEQFVRGERRTGIEPASGMETDREADARRLAKCRKGIVGAGRDAGDRCRVTPHVAEAVGVFP